MPRKPNYNFQKRNKELARQAKKDAKLEKRQREKREAEAEAQPTSEPVVDAE